MGCGGGDFVMLQGVQCVEVARDGHRRLLGEGTLVVAHGRLRLVPQPDLQSNNFSEPWVLDLEHTACGWTARDEVVVTPAGDTADTALTVLRLLHACEDELCDLALLLGLTWPPPPERAPTGAEAFDSGHAEAAELAASAIASGGSAAARSKQNEFDENMYW